MMRRTHPTARAMLGTVRNTSRGEGNGSATRPGCCPRIDIAQNGRPGDVAMVHRVSPSHFPSCANCRLVLRSRTTASCRNDRGFLPMVSCRHDSRNCRNSRAVRLGDNEVLRSPLAPRLLSGNHALPLPRTGRLFLRTVKEGAIYAASLSELSELSEGKKSAGITDSRDRKVSAVGLHEGSSMRRIVLSLRPASLASRRRLQPQEDRYARMRCMDWSISMK